MAGIISENAQKIQNKPKNYFTTCTRQEIFLKNQKKSQILKSTRGSVLSTNGGGEFLSCLAKN